MLMQDVARGDLQRAIGPEAGEHLARIDEAIAGSPERFAVIKIGGEMAQGDRLQQLGGSVAHLTRLGYIPVLVHGGGPQINARLEQTGIAEERINGDRVTPPEAMTAVEGALKGVNEDIRTRLDDEGVAAVGVLDAFDSELKDYGNLGLVGTPISVDIDRITAIVREGKVPVIACLGRVMVGGELRSTNINGDDAAAKLVAALNPVKFLTLTGPGGVKDKPGRIIPNLTDKRAGELIEAGVIDGGMAKKAKAILQLIGDGVRDDGVLTRPESIIPELFTHEGAGTLITEGVSFNRHDNLNAVDLKRVQELIEDAFGGHLSEDYFEVLGQDMAGVYITPQRYDGIAVTRRRGHRPDGPIYIDKLAVTPGEQGRGIADQLLRQVEVDAEGGLFWRADPKAAFLQKYEDFADESHHAKDADGKQWTVFFKNMNPQDIEAALQWAASQPITIERHPDDAPF